MNKLSKKQEQEFEDYVNAANDAYADLSGAVDTFNQAMRDAWLAVEEAQNIYNNARDIFIEWQQGINADQQQYYDERSEKWQDSEKGRAYSAWMEQYQNEELLEESNLECPEELEVDVPEPGEAVYDLPFAVEWS